MELIEQPEGASPDLDLHLFFDFVKDFNDFRYDQKALCAGFCLTIYSKMILK
jgi:hypothetical protein